MVPLQGLFLAPHFTFYRYTPKANALVNLMFVLGPRMKERECVGKRIKSGKTRKELRGMNSVQFFCCSLSSFLGSRCHRD